VFLEVFAEEALAQAQLVDEKLKTGTAGRLAGMVLSIKDNIVYKGHKSSASSKILGGFESQFTATALQRLLAEDAIIIGRTNCDEFAMGSSNENSAFGPVLNPLDETRVPGGSSGGAAASVAGHLCFAALGSDTGGSIRQPASFTGTVGLKPTYGRISRWGLIAYGSSFDQIGPITHTVEDCALLTEIMAGLDALDNTSSSSPVGSLMPNTDMGKAPKKIGVIREALETPGMDAGVQAMMEQFINWAKSEGHTVEIVDLPVLDKLVPIYYILTTAEASSNLARFDGVRYGYRSGTATTTDELYYKSRSEGFGPEVKRRIMLGTFVLSTGYYDAYYTKAMRVRRLLTDQTSALLAQYDFLLSPTTPTTAFRAGEKSSDPIEMYLSDIFTVHANLVGMPAISLPLFTHSNGLPCGLQLLANSFQEQKLLSFGQYVMQSLRKE
jgi:aspartyl-tRNA(Asn)/glutamyl-tRNA(Gln) amidotransferase subunit A